MKQIGEFLIGLVLLIVGVVVFLQNVVVNSFSLLYKMNGISVGGILLVLIMIAFIAMLVKPTAATRLIFGLLVVVFFVCLIISLNIRVGKISGLELALMLGSICVGIALMIRALIPTKPKDSM